MEHKQNFIIPIAILAAGVMIMFAIIFAPGRERTPQSSTAGNEAATEAEKLAKSAAAGAALAVRSDDHILGNPTAPVTIIEFGDFQCPFCGRFHKTVSPQLRERYIKTGKVKFIWRDFAFLGQESTDAARAAHCAGAQEKFWDYHDYIFEHQNGENRGAFAVPNLKQFARVLGLDQAAFDQCLDSQKYADTVASDTKIGREVGVSGTPTTFVNGEQVVGLVPFETIEGFILSALQ